MTIREHITRKRRLFNGIAVAAWLAAVGVMVLSLPDLNFGLLFLCFIIMMGSVAGSLFLIKCPRCRGRLGMADARQPFRKPQEAKFCPYCGVGLDEEI